MSGAGQLTLASGSSSAFSFDSDAEARILNIASLVVEDGASIGANATIVCGHRIGRCAMIGAGAVVASDVPPHALIT